MSAEILILEAPGGELEGLSKTFAAAAPKDCRVTAAADSNKLLQGLAACRGACMAVVDCLLGDGKLPGSEIIREVRRQNPEIPVVAVAERGDVELASSAVNHGATDFLVRGENLGERVATLMGKMSKLFGLMERNRRLSDENRRLSEEAGARYKIVGTSAQTADVIRRIERVAKVPRPVLIVGERGTGKEVAARAIHAAGEGPGRPIITVNCAAFTESLLESELFGHEKGSFTGADRRAQGKFEQAAGGTLFLDEIGNMSLPFQQKILRVVEYGVFTRVGGSEEIRTDARIIAATNADLEEKMRKGEFLRDLHDRLSFEVIRIPPLRERPEDIEVLARHFLEEFMKEIPALGGKQLADSAISALRRYDFPGNVRELKNIIERAAYRDVTNEITPEDIGLLPEHAAEPEGDGFEEMVENFRKRLVLDALNAAGGNGAAAARALGLSYHQFRYYLKKYS
ncbi:MAG: sigma-54-dependent transcriptional regulator [Planctomycetota bacterium]|jgi:DNA-binding NtrC family response regulator